MKLSLAALAATLCVLALLCLGLWQHNRLLASQLTAAAAQLQEAAENLKRQQTQHEAAMAKAANALANTQAEKAQLKLHMLTLSGGQAMPASSSTQALLSTLEEGKLQDLAGHKYQLLWGDLTLSPAKREQLKKLLVDRERVLNSATTTYFTDDLDANAAVATQQSLLADIDGQIAKVLDSKEFAQYELFKDSGFEQFQLGQLNRVLGPDGALTEDQKRRLLMAKLRHKQQFSHWLEKQGTAENQTQSLNDMIDAYRTGYLQDARANLSEHQFKLLNDYENLQFEQMQKSLKASQGD